MWADAQRDGRPAECTWRPLLNAVDQIAKITKPRREPVEICLIFNLLRYCIRRRNRKLLQLEMWANAQRDGRPAEYRWRPLFNAAKSG